MNELDFIEALSEKTERRAQELMSKLKTSGVKDLVAKHGRQIGAGLAGAGALTGLAYSAFKPGKGGKSSAEQKLTSMAVASNEAMKDQAERDGRPLTFREDFTDAVVPATKRVADTMARHPVKGSLLFAPVGAVAGLRILKMLT